MDTKNEIIICPKCGQKLSIPANKTLHVTCPKCKHSFTHEPTKTTSSRSSGNTTKTSGYNSTSGASKASGHKTTTRSSDTTAHFDTSGSSTTKSTSGSAASSNKNSTNTSGSLFWIAVLIFAFWYLYTHTAMIFPEDHMDRVSEFCQYMEKTVPAPVSEADDETYQNAVIAELDQILAGSNEWKIKSYTKSENAVRVQLKDGIIVLFAPMHPNTKSGAFDSTLHITSFEPYKAEWREKAGYEFANKTDETCKYIETISVNWSHNRDVEDFTANSDAVEHLGEKTQQIIFWDGHGYWTSEDKGILCLNETPSHYVQSHGLLSPLDFKNGKVMVFANGHIGITAKYIRKKVKNLDNALIFLSTCYSGKSADLANAFMNKGASVVVGFDNEVSLGYGLFFPEAFFKSLCGPDQNGDFPSAQQAFSNAIQSCGTSDPYFSKHARPVIFGNGRSYSLGSMDLQRDYEEDYIEPMPETVPETVPDPAHENEQAPAYTPESSSDNGQTPDPDYDISDQQTAPMPDHVISSDEIIGSWSPDIDSPEPTFIDFYYGDDGQLYYDYYRILLGNGSGINIANERTKFEYNHGLVSFMGNQGSCACLSSSGSGKVYIGFYLFEIQQGVITDQEDGTNFYRVY